MSMSLNDILEDQAISEINTYLNCGDSPEVILANLLQYTNLSQEKAEELVENKFGGVDYDEVRRILTGED